MGLPRSTVVENPPANAGDTKDAGSISGLGKSPGGGHGNPLQYSCLENPMAGGFWQATVHRVRQSRTRLSDVTTTYKVILKYWLYSLSCTLHHCITDIFLNFYLFSYLFIFVCAGSSLLPALFSSFGEWGLLSCGAWVLQVVEHGL